MFTFAILDKMTSFQIHISFDIVHHMLMFWIHFDVIFYRFSVFLTYSFHTLMPNVAFCKVSRKLFYKHEIQKSNYFHIGGLLQVFLKGNNVLSSFGSMLASHRGRMIPLRGTSKM